MCSFVLPLMYGSIGIAIIFGIGRLALGTRLELLPWYARLALAAIAGQFIAFVISDLVLTFGFGSTRNLRVEVAALAAVAAAGYFRKAGRMFPTRSEFAGSRLSIIMLAAAYAANAAIALAPSTKFDELTYHMLAARRVIWDQGLRYYRLPIEAAITPQMHFQLFQSMSHALNAPDAGNLLSVSFSAALVVLIAGFCTEVSGSGRIGWISACVCGVGIYNAVLHTTSAPNALGALSVFLLAAGAVRPEMFKPRLGPDLYVLMLSLAGSAAAATKISIWPLSTILLALVVFRASRDSLRALPRIAVLALLPWVALHTPFLVWTYMKSGSPFGPILANVFRHSIYIEAQLNLLDRMRVINQAPLTWIRFAVVELSPVFLLAIPAIIYCVMKSSRLAAMTLAILAIQIAVIVWALPYEVRFLGGLEYFAVAVAMSETYRILKTGPAPEISRASPGEINSRRGAVLLCVFALPWLLGQLYFSMPFAGVVLGIAPRGQFFHRYVGLYDDFSALDHALPPNSVIWIPAGRLANEYSPRRVYLTYSDLPFGSDVYRLTIVGGTVDGFEQSAPLRCEETVYRDNSATLETYRTPGRVPLMGAISVERCSWSSGGH